MKLFVNAPATVKDGPCRGIKGKLIYANWLEKEVEIRVDNVTIIKTAWDNVEQEGEK